MDNDSIKRISLYNNNLLEKHFLKFVVLRIKHNTRAISRLITENATKSLLEQRKPREYNLSSRQYVC